MFVFKDSSCYRGDVVWKLGYIRDGPVKCLPNAFAESPGQRVSLGVVEAGIFGASLKLSGGVILFPQSEFTGQSARLWSAERSRERHMRRCAIYSISDQSCQSSVLERPSHSPAPTGSVRGSDDSWRLLTRTCQRGRNCQFTPQGAVIGSIHVGVETPLSADV